MELPIIVVGVFVLGIMFHLSEGLIFWIAVGCVIIQVLLIG